MTQEDAYKQALEKFYQIRAQEELSELRRRTAAAKELKEGTGVEVFTITKRVQELEEVSLKESREYMRKVEEEYVELTLESTFTLHRCEKLIAMFIQTDAVFAWRRSAKCSNTTPRIFEKKPSKRVRNI